MPTVIQVRWAANAAAEQVSNYQVFESKDGGAFTFKANVAPSTSPLGLDVLNPLPGVYSYKIKAQNLAGDSPESDPASSPGVPTKPATPTVTVVVT